MRKLYVSPRGPLNAKIAICGEQPGRREVLKGKPFVGPAGQGLEECLKMAKVPSHNIYYTNTIKDLDAPISHYISIDHKKRTWYISDDGWTYINELRDELSALEDLNVVVATGNIPLIALTMRLGITKWRGSVLESTLVENLKVVPTIHPATFIKPKYNYLNKPLIVEDLTRAKRESEYKEIRRTGREIIISPSFRQAVDFVNYCYEAGKRGRTIDLDIEVINGEVDCIALAYEPTKAISIPFRDSQGDYFTISQESEIMACIARIMEDETIAKRGANFIFDSQFLFRKYGIVPNGPIHCTQIAQKITYPDYPAGLDFVTNMWTDIPYYKLDGKQWIKMGAGTWEKWWNYNGLDAIATCDAHPKQVQELKKIGNFETYERQRKLIKPLIYMSERGIKVDVAGMADCKVVEESKLKSLADELSDEVGYEINYNSSQQLARYFYTDCKIKPYTKKNTSGKWVPTTDVDALKRIARRKINGSRAAELMLDIRSLSKRISTYLNIGKVDPDGRYRSSYKPVGAETGRLSSGETIFETGGNQQNWPHDLLRFFVFDDGYLGYAIDLSQVENRIVAYVGGVIEQIEAFEQGIDLHRLTASIIFGKPYDEISGKDGSSSLGDGRQSERYWGKKGNHATNYDVGYRTFALKNEMPEAIAKETINRIHRGYPQIKQVYHQIIQKMLIKNRTVTNLFGRNRIFLGPILPSYPNVSKYACVKTYREAYAHLPQSTVADKINEQGLEYVYYNQSLFEPVELLAQIHDSIVFQIPLSVPLVEHSRILHLIKDSLEQPLYYHDRIIPTPADISIGLNMCKEDMIELKSKQIPGDIYKLADVLKETQIKLEANKVKTCQLKEDALMIG